MVCNFASQFAYKEDMRATNIYKSIDFDSDDTMKMAKETLKNKECLYKDYVDTYNMMIKYGDAYLTCEEGLSIELGSGGGFFKEICPNVITSDVTPVNGVDMVIDAQELPFENNSLSRIYAVHVIHHIPNIDLFFLECVRCLKSGGGVVIVEPYWSPVGKFFYKRLHPEPFDEKAKEWKFASTGNMTGANQAISYLVFKRDRKQFEKKYPELEIMFMRPFNGVSYLATGGLWLKQYLPNWGIYVIDKLEKILWPIMYLFGIHHIIVLRKKVTG